MDALPYRIERERLLVDVRLTPRGGRDAVEGAETLADGRAVLKARVRAVPEDGKANAALESLIAAELGIGRSQVAVIHGKTARLKTLAVQGDPARLSAGLARFLAAALLLLLTLAGTPASAQFMTRGDICSDPSQFLRSRATVERAGLPTPDRARLVRTLRAAQSLARDACPNRDGWLVRRAVGMLNAVNREVRLPPVDLPLFLRE
ncbi:hypothetical protein C6569_17305 [Phreatobacter cathodiphilus]|uniref:UPF0235 protein C6569_17305 n=1 Tax=Phreatobacter cathodiphilus TaxID=1868589 RepID=A0A2S0NF33_9HYPH|nr:hypothetical protein C6569_17305 [Phreatobacter cathodiphilus]